MTDVRAYGTSIDARLGEPTLCHAFLATVEATPDALALSDFGSERTLTYRAWHERSRRVAGGLVALGVTHGDRVALLCQTRLEFHVVDVGALLVGAVPVSLYATSPPAQLAPMIDNCGARVLIVDDALADHARGLRRLCPDLEHLVILDGAAVGELDLDALEALCPAAFDINETARAVRGSDLCSLVYTSGTTGKPKGVPYLHRCLMETMKSLHGHVPVSPDGRVISYLPMAHIAERMFGHYAAFVFGCHVTSLPDASQLGAALREVCPTRFFGVPRIWEKLLAGVHRALNESFTPEEAARIRAAWDQEIERVRREQAGQPAPAGGQERKALAAIPAMLGLDCAEWLGVAGAPASPELLTALHALGLKVNELYGMSETIIVSTSPPARVKIGTCGVALPGVKIRIAQDGEILVGGVTVMEGYFGDPEQTKAVLDDGWMHTGDIGTLDDDGYLRITDRKKALIINSGGKNMSPAAIEQAIQGGVPLIAQVVAIGDHRSYNVGLIVLDRDGLEAFRIQRGLAQGDFAVLSREPTVRAEVERAVQAGNEKLSRIEQIKRFAVLDHEWAPASDELTPTGKLKRKPIEQKYAAVIEELYA